MSFRTVSTADLKKKREEKKKKRRSQKLHNTCCRARGSVSIFQPHRGVSSSYAVRYYIIADIITGHIPDDIKARGCSSFFAHWKPEPAEACVALTPISHSPDHSARAMARPLMTPHNSSNFFFFFMRCQPRRRRELAASLRVFAR